MPEEILRTGDTAPTFKLPASDGSTVDLKSLLGKGRIVLYFYPKADTPGCTVEACGFRDAIASYRKLTVPVFGISPDPLDAVRDFADKFDLTFPLLADADHSVCEKYGVWQQKTMFGNKYMGVVRTTFIIGADGRIEHVFERVNPEGHEKEVMGWLEGQG
jgi:thioredoxin-dependent peroxiredoxin